MRGQVHRGRMTAAYRARASVAIVQGACLNQPYVMGGEPQSSAQPSRRLTARFEGHVQGVGFRFTVMQVARAYPVRGYVQNLVDGDVQLVAEGMEQDVLEFLGAVRASHVFRFVTQERLSWAPASGEFVGFEVRYA